MMLRITPWLSLASDGKKVKGTFLRAERDASEPNKSWIEYRTDSGLLVRFKPSALKLEYQRVIFRVNSPNFLGDHVSLLKSLEKILITGEHMNRLPGHFTRRHEGEAPPRQVPKSRRHLTKEQQQLIQDLTNNPVADARRRAREDSAREILYVREYRKWKTAKLEREQARLKEQWAKKVLTDLPPDSSSDFWSENARRGNIIVKELQRRDITGMRNKSLKVEARGARKKMGKVSRQERKKSPEKVEVQKKSDLKTFVTDCIEQHPDWAKIDCCREVLSKYCVKGHKDYTAEKLANLYTKKK